MNKFKLEPDQIVEAKLSAIVDGIEAIVKPFQNTVRVEIEKANNVPSAIRITVEIKNPK